MAKIARHLKIANRKTEFGIVSITIERFSGNFLHLANPTQHEINKWKFFQPIK
jgi:hypothetical protein